MRRIATHIEGLAAVPFILLVGLIAGALQSLPHFLLSGPGASNSRLMQFLVLGSFAVLWWTAALFLWWIAVHRARWSLWELAAHLTLALAFADLLTRALGMVSASIETHGAFAEALRRQPWTVASSNLVLPPLRSPFWFLGSALAVALGAVS